MNAVTDLDASVARINDLTDQLAAQRDGWKSRAVTAEAVLVKIRTTNPDLVEMAEAMVRQENS